MRPKKTRWVKCLPGERCFRPKCRPPRRLDGVILSIDEFEAMRLAYLEEMKQVDAAKLMKISRPTFSRIIASAHKKIADALVNIKAIKIEGGCCKIKTKSKR
ncbi:hypothetical protein BU251_07380 [Candidatus Velamenicoccus archaeovorus]|uniref:UPF0251 protein BU251_07380 n=1 Tax=Velamenicoccus archaeovorus TaxID=1930593 RepID=A0A410P5W7_VELA1|nr:DUF134 domain-containing protein [Candidatus Velamenicoccus archaeovorus]QAT17550.1 hypothetical protein BU251_07380 [Candidatus Velamenicoccus archaeovorus]